MDALVAVMGKQEEQDDFHNYDLVFGVIYFTWIPSMRSISCASLAED